MAANGEGQTDDPSHQQHRTIRELGGELWAELSTLPKGALSWQVRDVIVDIVMGVLARHTGSAIETIGICRSSRCLTCPLARAAAWRNGQVHDLPCVPFWSGTSVMSEPTGTAVLSI